MGGVDFAGRRDSRGDNCETEVDKCDDSSSWNDTTRSTCGSSCAKTDPLRGGVPIGCGPSSSVTRGRKFSEASVITDVMCAAIGVGTGLRDVGGGRHVCRHSKTKRDVCGHENEDRNKSPGTPRSSLDKKTNESSSKGLSIGSVIGGVPSLKKLQGASNDDYVDRLNHVWTVFLMALFAIVVSTSQFVGDPIHCWCPAEFTGAYVDYAKSYCWIKNTYYIPMDTPIPVNHENRSSEELTYYQWVPLILLFQAFMFKFPNILWRLFNGGSGINLDKIVDMAEKTQMGSPDDRDKTIDHIAKYMDRWLEAHRQIHNNVFMRAKETMSKVCCFVCNKRAGTYLTGFYLFIKVVYATNVICQFFILNAFLSQDYNLYGFEVLKMLGSSNEEWRESTRFPRVTLCDFKIRQLQNIQTWTVQCVLPINLFNEKIFMVIWFWLVLVATMTSINLISWLYRIIFKRNRYSYIKKYLKITHELHTGFDKKLCEKFANEYLRDDGVFVLRVVSKNSTELVATDLVHKLWTYYKTKQVKKKDERTPDYMASPKNQAAHDKEKEAMMG